MLRTSSLVFLHDGSTKPPGLLRILGNDKVAFSHHLQMVSFVSSYFIYYISMTNNWTSYVSGWMERFSVRRSHFRLLTCEDEEAWDKLDAEKREHRGFVEFAC